MTTLRTISLSNIRRFREDVRIDVSPGATIILAPNGTGKTSIFEAIELALTGEVKRLDFPPNPIIKESALTASIRLDFNDGYYCETVFQRGGEPSKNGSHTDIFKHTEAKNIPYLLRLTHLLNQNNKEWLVQCGSEVAATHLDSLAIGKDALMAQKAMTSTKRAATTIVAEIQREFEQAELKRSEWLAELEKRTDFANRSTDKLVSKAEILRRIDEVAVSLDTVRRDAKEHLPSIKSYLTEILGEAGRKQELLSTRLKNLLEVQAALKDYLALIEIIRLAENSLKTLLEERDGLTTQISSRDGELKGFQLGILEKGRQSFELEQKKKAILELERIRSSQQATRKLLEEAGVSLNDGQKMLPTLSEQLRQMLALQKSHQELAAKEGDLLKLQNRITRLQTWQAEWRGFENKLATRAQRLREIDEQILGHEGSIKASEEEYNGHLQSVEAAQLRYDNLSKSTDAIKEAVAVIAANVKSSDTVCPVCSTEFIEPELYDRIQSALQLVNQELLTASDALQDAKKNLNTSNGTLTGRKRNKSILLTEKSNIQQEIDSLENDLSNVRLNFSNVSSISESEAGVATLIKSAEDTAQKLQASRSELAPLPQVSGVTILENSVQSLKNAIQKHQQRIDELNRSLGQLSNEETSALKLVGSEPDINSLNSKAQTIQDEIRGLEANANNIASVISNLRANLSGKNDDCAAAEKLLQQHRSAKMRYVDTWQTLGLTDEPSVSAIDVAIAKASGESLDVRNNIQTLTPLHADLDRWNGYEEYSRVEKKIKDLIGDKSEGQYGAALQSDFDVREKRLANAKRRQETLNTFSNHLKKEVETIHERIEAINPIWTRLLSRIVVDSRFSAANLSHYDHYNKPHADFNVPLNGEKVSVTQVASEAQLTDVQFSFLLAMATKYRWTDWKALLLDDPTQHHDLVHAASVFDLLRDYIAEHGFQVVLATHDSVQADFFKRKMENDGLPYNFYVLEADEAGVNAVLQ